VVIFILLYWFCVPASLFFVTRTGWRFTTKLVVGFVSFGAWILIAFALVALRSQTLQ
jgi:hypothetical protein